MEEIKTEHGIFTEITDRDGNVLKTAEEHYQWVLENRDIPQEPQPNEIDILNLKIDTLENEKQILAQNVLDLTSVVEAMLLGGIE